MAIVSCPFCGKKISSKAASCQHCGQNLADVTPDQLMRAARDKRMATAQSINNHAMLSMVLFLSSVLYYYFKEPDPESVQGYLTHLALGVGFLGYLVSKIRMIMHKRQ